MTPLEALRAALSLERFGPLSDLEAERFLGVWAGRVATRPP